MNSGYKIEGGLQTSYTSVTVNTTPSIVEVQKMVKEAGFQIFPKNEGFETITKKEYERLTAKKSWWVKLLIDESPRAIWAIITAGIITGCGVLYANHKASKKAELEQLKAELKKEILAETKTNTPATYPKHR